MNDISFPKPLSKGGQIAIISPAGAVQEQQLESTLEVIRSKGFEPIFGKYTLGKFNNGYSYSGTERERIQDLNWAFNDPHICAIWASRGGYGCQHLLRHLRLSSFKKKPKWYIGYSDNTVIQSYLLKNKVASIHGQTIKTSSFGVSKDSYEGIFRILNGERPKYQLVAHPFNKKGKISGMLVGGNLALIYALLASPYSYKFKDNILFIEDIGENFYALDRMLMALDLAGVFRKIKGMVIGGMINMDDEKENPHFEESFDPFAYEIIKQRIAGYDFPVAYGFPNGHIFENHPLILGAEVTLEIGKQVHLTF